MESRKHSWSAWLVWGLSSLLVALAVLGVGLKLAQASGQPVTAALISGALFYAVPVPFALIAALILARQPRHVVGWLLLVPAIDLVLSTLGNLYLATYPTEPAAPTLLQYLLVWYTGWSWIGLLFPIVLIPLFFPTGRPPSRPWRWVVVGLAVEALILITLATFSVRLTPEGADDVSWTLPNPIGFIAQAQAEAVISQGWIQIFGALTLLCVASLFVRYYRAGAVVRAQIKWLLYAVGLFALFYVPGLFISITTPDWDRTLLGNLANVVLGLSLFTIPSAIAIAILRYRLWDIDVIIRRTLIYSVLTGMLALLYFGGVVVVQPVVTQLTGQGTALTTVLITLLIAALFTPARRRVQAAIDQRFYRRKYDATAALAAFASSARDETDLDQLSARLGRVVEQTVQPAQVSLWLRPQSAAQPPGPTPAAGISRRE